MEKRKIIGTTLILIGFLFILNSFPGITGFAVAESVGKGVSGVLGLVFVVGGVLVFMSGRLDDKLRIYADPNKSGDEAYYLNDPFGLFGNNGIVGFVDFLDQAKEIRSDSELLGLAKSNYAGPLIEIVENEGEYSDIAKRCLKAIDIDYLEEDEKNSILDAGEIQEIKNVFNIWDGKITPQQRRVLLKYGIRYDSKKKKTHPSLTTRYGDSIPISASPSDSARGNKNLVSSIRRLCESVRQNNSNQ